MYQRQYPFCGEECLGETVYFSVIVSLVLWDKLITLPDAADDKIFLLGDLDFQKLLPTFSGFSFLIHSLCILKTPLSAFFPSLFKYMKREFISICEDRLIVVLYLSV